MNVLVRGILAFFLPFGIAHAALIDRGGGMIYDDVLNITWLQDANYAKTSGYDTDGRMTWSEANSWASNLAFGGYSDWRLPATNIVDPTCEIQNGTSFGGNCLGNEFGELFYGELGGQFHSPITDSLDPDLQLFSNISTEPSILYWYGSAWEDGNRPGFYFYDGTLNYGVPDNEFYAWAVRDGDVQVASAVPEPSIVLLLIAALGILWTARIQQNPAG